MKFDGLNLGPTLPFSWEIQEIYGILHSFINNEMSGIPAILRKVSDSGWKLEINYNVNAKENNLTTILESQGIDVSSATKQPDNALAANEIAFMKKLGIDFGEEDLKDTKRAAEEKRKEIEEMLLAKIRGKSLELNEKERNYMWGQLNTDYPECRLGFSCGHKTEEKFAQLANDKDWKSNLEKVLSVILKMENKLEALGNLLATMIFVQQHSNNWPWS